MVPAGDLFALKRALMDVMVSPKLQAEMSEKGRRHAARFTMRRMAEETLKIYEDVVN
jgi:glycosyltransferase involved in cell wall biosynthesis